jgi:lysophospholipase L1-like esterase
VVYIKNVRSKVQALIMKQSAALVIAYSVFLSAGIACAEVLIKPNDANINYYGRFDFSNSAATVPFNWPGAIIEACFPGPSIGVELNDGNGGYFNVEIDGVLVDSLSPTTTTHRTIKTNLSTANHTIRITLRTNATNCAFGGFYLADGKALATRPPQPTRKIEFIGDSWTAGNVMGQTSGADNLKYYNASLTYARLTSLAYHAQDKLVARGGCGLVTSNGGAANMPARYPKILCDGTSNWDFASWIPGLVVVFLGINDFNNGVTDANFRTAYISFINTIRGHYPDVPIILIGLAGNVLTDVKTVAQSFANVRTFSSPVTLANARALWAHPDAAQNRQIADSLIPVVKLATGWDTAAPVGIRVPDPKQEVRYAAGANPGLMKTSQDRIVFRSKLSGVDKEIIVYDCSGRPLRKLVTGKQTLFLSRDLGLPPGVYLIKTTALRQCR